MADYSGYVTVGMEAPNLWALQTAAVAAVESFATDPATDPKVIRWLVKSLKLNDLSVDSTALLLAFVKSHMGYLVLRPALLAYAGVMAPLTQATLVTEIKNHIVAMVDALKVSGDI